MSVAITFDDVSVTDKRKIIVDADIITSSAADAEAARQAAEEAEASAESASGYAESASASAEAAGASAESAAASAEEAEQAVSGLTEDVEELQEQMQAKAPVIINTASGSIASFSDGADDMPCKSVVCNVDAVQDLHGQDAPYPAGGSANLLDPSVYETTSAIKVDAVTNGLKLTVLTEGTYKSVANYVPFTGHDGSTLYLKSSIVNSGSNNGVISVRFCDDSGEISGSTRLENYSTRSSHYVAVPTGTTRLNIVLYATMNNSASVNDTATLTNMMLSLTDTAYKPYSNICPITGWDGVEVVRTGVNIWDEETERGSISSTTGEKTLNPSGNSLVTKNFIPVLPNTEYYLGCSSLSTNARTRFYDRSKNYIGYVNALGSGINWNATTGNTRCITPANAYYMMFELPNTYGTTYNNDISINYPSTDHDYHASNVDSHSISFPSTVYGGWVDVVKGELHVTHAVLDLNGSERWGIVPQDQNAYFLLTLSNDFMYTTTNISVKSSHFAPIANAQQKHNDNTIWVVYKQLHIHASSYIAPSGLTDAGLSEFKSWLAEHNTQAFIPLATETIISIDPVIIKTLLGNNNIYADTGDSSVEYPADTRLYIEHLTAPDHDMVADSNIASGKFFMVGNSLYISTSAIAQGETIRPGTNCTLINLAQALNQLAEG